MQSAQIANTVRRSSLVGVLEAHLRKLAENSGIENYREVLARVQNDPSAYDVITEQERTFYDTAAGLGAWIPITACVSPYITIGEWSLLGEDVIDELSSAALELNPQWFETQTAPETEKKSKSKRKRH